MATKKQTNKITTAKEETTVAVKTTSKKSAVKPAAQSAKTEPAPVEKKSAAVKAKTAVKETAAPVQKTEKKATPVKIESAKKTKVTFVLPKEAVENAETVAVLGDFNQWDIQKGIELKKQKDGSFKTAVELEAGRSYQFRFLIDGQRWENSWNAEAYEPTPFGNFNSVVKA